MRNSSDQRSLGIPMIQPTIDECMIERDWGWVFFYTSDRYLKTRDIRYALAGNAPYIVNRHTGEVRVTGTAQPIEYYIAEYERRLANG